MNKSGFFLIICCLCLARSFAQSPPIGAQRPLDNNHALAADSADWKLHRIIKEITLQQGNPVALLSVGGEIREQLRYYNHVNFGDVDSGVSDRDLYLQQRFMLHADLRVNCFLRIFTQFNSCHVTGKNTLSSQIDRDDLGLMLAFADLHVDAPFPVQLRLGRQEFSYGPERILGLRDGPTVRQTFDGARLSLGLNRISGDIFLVVPISYQTGVFDNIWRRNEYVLASYWSLPLTDNNLLDVYYFGVQFQNSCYAGDTANENRHSAGLRLSKSTGSFGYDAEFTCQFGQHGKNDIRAWQISSQFAYRWQKLSWQPRLLIREAVFSGDRKQSDGVINTFRPVSAKPPVHDLVPIGPANLGVVSPEAEITLIKGMTFTLRYLFVWRLSANDGMYQPDARKMTRENDLPGENQGKLIAKGITADLSYAANEHFTILIYGGLFKPGKYLQNTGQGRNVEAFSIKTTYRL